MFTKLLEKSPDALKHTPKSIGYLAGDNISRFEQELTSLYPDNGAKIEVSKLKTTTYEKTTGTYASRDMTLSWSFQSKSAKCSYATLNLRDGTVLSVKKSSGPTSITISTADGLVVDFLPEKKILQRISCFESINNSVTELEMSRMIHSDVFFILI